VKRIAIQGEPGSNSHLATKELLGEAELLPCALSVEVLEKLARSNEADAAVLPVENSLHGAVADHSDLLLRYGVQIVAECSLRIRHALIVVPGVHESQVTRVLSHPVALSQCRMFFSEHKRMEAVPFYDTAGAVKHLMANHVTSAAAIAAPFAAEVYGAEILRSGLEDDPKNFTRFFLLARAEDVAALRPAGTVVNKMSLAFDLPHRPGSLLEALQGLAAAGADLTRIESRPVPGRPWEYTFFVDLRIPSEAAADTVVVGLRAICHDVVELGRYEAAIPPAE
jgi:prephenate dehydratase